jgi:hypothetical protein
MRKALICLGCVAWARLFGQGIPFGVEFRVNSYMEGWQNAPSATILTNGNFVVCWESVNQDGSGMGVFGQLFSSNGARIGQEFRVNTFTTDYQGSPQIARLQNGGFAVCWRSDALDGSQKGVYGQLFASDGSMKGREFRVNTYDEYEIWNPKITSLQNGGFSVCWMSHDLDGSDYGVYGQVFSSDGAKIGQEFRANTYIWNDQAFQEIESLSNGGFVICWDSLNQDGSGWGVYGQVFSSDAARTGPEFRVNAYTRGDQGLPRIAALMNGSFAVCWVSYGQDDSYAGVYGQVFSSDGSKLGHEFRVSTLTANFQGSCRIASLPAGCFAVCWESYGQDGSDRGVYGRVFSAEGHAIVPEFRVNTFTGLDQYNPQITVLTNGNFVVGWESRGQDGSDSGGYGQIFSSDGTRLGNEFRINSLTDFDQRDFVIAASLNGGFVVCWDSYGRNGSESDIYAKLFRESPLNHELKSFNLLEPSNDSSIKTVDPLLVWRQPSEQSVCYPWELHYVIYVDDNPGFHSPREIDQDQDTTAIVPGLLPGTTYFWKVLAKNISGDSLWSSNTNGFFVLQDATDGVEDGAFTEPEEFTLHQNYPNPFNPETSIRFDLPENGFVSISVCDVHGRWVETLLNESRTTGNYSVTWDGRDQTGNSVPSGVYICRMDVRSSDGRRYSRSVKMGLVR